MRVESRWSSIPGASTVLTMFLGSFSTNTRNPYQYFSICVRHVSRRLWNFIRARRVVLLDVERVALATGEEKILAKVRRASVVSTDEDDAVIRLPALDERVALRMRTALHLLLADCQPSRARERSIARRCLRRPMPVVCFLPARRAKRATRPIRRP